MRAGPAQVFHRRWGVAAFTLVLLLVLAAVGYHYVDAAGSGSGVAVADGVAAPYALTSAVDAVDAVDAAAAAGADSVWPAAARVDDAAGSRWGLDGGEGLGGAAACVCLLLALLARSLRLRGRTGPWLRTAPATAPGVRSFGERSVEAVPRSRLLLSVSLS